MPASVSTRSLAVAVSVCLLDTWVRWLLGCPSKLCCLRDATELLALRRFDDFKLDACPLKLVLFENCPSCSVALVRLVYPLTVVRFGWSGTCCCVMISCSVRLFVLCRIELCLCDCSPSWVLVRWRLFPWKICP